MMMKFVENVQSKNARFISFLSLKSQCMYNQLKLGARIIVVSFFM